VRASLAATTGEGRARRWRYSAGEARLVAAVEALALAYESSRLEVMHVMTQNAFRRIRTSAVATFAEAFRLGGRKNG
jgi:hypothetical protein